MCERAEGKQHSCNHRAKPNSAFAISDIFDYFDYWINNAFGVFLRPSSSPPSPFCAVEVVVFFVCRLALQIAHTHWLWFEKPKVLQSISTFRFSLTNLLFAFYRYIEAVLYLMRCTREQYWCQMSVKAFNSCFFFQFNRAFSHSIS